MNMQKKMLDYASLLMTNAALEPIHNPNWANTGSLNAFTGFEEQFSIHYGFFQGYATFTVSGKRVASVLANRIEGHTAERTQVFYRDAKIAGRTYRVDEREPMFKFHYLKYENAQEIDDFFTLVQYLTKVENDRPAEPAPVEHGGNGLGLCIGCGQYHPKEFDLGYALPGEIFEALGAGWTDHSWHDALPHMERPLAGPDRLTLTFWWDCANQADGEFRETPEQDYARYTLHLQDSDYSGIQTLLHKSSDVQDMARAIQRVRRNLGTRGTGGILAEAVADIEKQRQEQRKRDKRDNPVTITQAVSIIEDLLEGLATAGHTPDGDHDDTCPFCEHAKDAEAWLDRARW